MRIPVIIDCDPGHDDAIALLLAFASPTIYVQAVTVVAGNQALEKTLKNAKNVLDYAGIRAKVAAGAQKPLFRELNIASHVHGESGLDGVILPPAKFEEVEITAVELMREIILKSNEKVVLIATGPLTNVALLLLTYPVVKDKIEYISLMGGACFGGNLTPVAEFNIAVDPEAAKIVFESGIPIVMHGLDVTYKAQIYRDEVETIRKLGGKVPIMAAELLDFYSKYYGNQGFKGTPLHDACAVAYVIDPTLFQVKHLHVDIETRGEFTNGETVVDYYNITGKLKNAKVAFDIDRKRFIDILVKALQMYQK
jgi:pyrimidine-specific ribonucleoside hydrolase